ncbi:DUF488 domain-containing protein [Aquisalimonas lutea]|uniref:DUF488 domain-containing protein n=1 Tax=Aquisalimonas lutea TaxID=1327750 RepID=UPI0025B3C9D9|nr:DUF488 domain-containing protein [Aquisalimonas lutea]MDN3517599.1 DUF488 domain-containing protein [Aquisalimonas lutea]
MSLKPHGEDPMADDTGIDGLFTIGYEGASMEAFTGTLRHHAVDLLVDVRQAPVSRRPGFSRKALAETLADSGIGYRHEGALGAPKWLRDQVREDGDYARFFRAYDEHLRAHGDRLHALAEALHGRVALMCYERDVAVCHRQSVAEALAARTGLEPVHLDAAA